MKNMRERFAWALVATLGLFVAASVTGVVQGGPLDPPGSPGSTMRTLDEVNGAWSRNLSASGGCASQRFDCIFNDEAVLDRNTGLVWTRSVTFTSPAALLTAHATCLNATNGGVKGWRLPTVEELASLMAPGNTNPALPTGHPFLNAVNGVLWTQTFAAVQGVGLVRTVDIGTGSAIGTLASDSNAMFWCVRGGSGHDGLK